MNRKQDKDKRSTVITIRCKVADKAKWQKKAAKQGITLSDLVTTALNQCDENEKL